GLLELALGGLLFLSPGLQVVQRPQNVEIGSGHADNQVLFLGGEADGGGHVLLLGSLIGIPGGEIENGLTETDAVIMSVLAIGKAHFPGAASSLPGGGASDVQAWQQCGAALIQNGVSGLVLGLGLTQGRVVTHGQL